MLAVREWFSARPAKLLGALVLAALSALAFLRSFAERMTVGAWIGLPGYEARIPRLQFDARVSWYATWLVPLLAALVLNRRTSKVILQDSVTKNPIMHRSIGDGRISVILEFLARLLLVYLATFILLLLFVGSVRLFEAGIR